MQSGKMAENPRKAAAMLEHALEELEELSRMLDEFQKDAEKEQLSAISEKMRAMAPRLNLLSLDPMCKSRENAPMLLRLSSGMKEAVTRSKQLAVQSQKETPHEHRHSERVGSGEEGEEKNARERARNVPMAVSGTRVRCLSSSAPSTAADDGSPPSLSLSAEELTKSTPMPYLSPVSAPEELSDSPLHRSHSAENTGSDSNGATPPTLEGWMTKRGESGLVKVWRMRWFRQVGSRLYYFDNPQSVLANGHIPLKQVKRIVKPNISNGLDIVTTSRTYHLQALDQQRRDQWFEGLTEWVEYLSLARKHVAKERLADIAAAGLSTDEEKGESSGAESDEEAPVSRDRLLSLEPEEEDDEETKEEVVTAEGGDDDRSTQRESLTAAGSGDGNVSGDEKTPETMEEKLERREKEVEELRRQLEAHKGTKETAEGGAGQEAYVERLLSQTKSLTEELSKREAQVSALTGAAEPLQSEIDQLHTKNNSLQAKLQQARDEMKAKDNYITSLRAELADLKENLAVARPGSQPVRSPGLHRYKEEMEKLRGSVRAHQTQNVFLSSELQRMEEEHRTYAEAQDHTLRRLKQELADVTKQYQELRQASLLAGGATASHLEELEEVKQELFYTLGVGIKLGLSREGRRCNVNIQSLFEEGKHIPYKKYNEWLMSRMAEASERNK